MSTVPASRAVGIDNWKAIRTFAGVRWRLWKASLNSRKASEIGIVLVNIFTPLIGVVVALAVFAMLRSGSMASQRVNVVLLVAATAPFTVGVGLAVGVSQAIPLQVLATEPLTRMQRALGSLVTVIVGPAGIFATMYAVSIAAGSAHSWSAVPLSVLSALVLVVLTFLLSRSTSSLLGLLVQRVPWLGKAITAAAGFGVYALYMITTNWLPTTNFETRRSLAAAVRRWPVASIGEALAAPLAGKPGGASEWLALAWSAVWIVPLLFVFAWASERVIVGSPTVHSGRARTAGRWRRLMGTGRPAAIASRTVTTRIRTVRGSVELVMAGGVGLAAMVMPVALSGGRSASLSGLASEIVIYLFAANAFGVDGPALGHEFLAGASARDQIIGKWRANMLMTAPIAAIGVLAAATVSGAWDLVPANVLLAAAGLFVGGSLALIQATMYPYAVPEDDNPFNSGNAGGFVAIVMFFVMAILMAIAVFPPAVGLYFAIRSGSVGWILTCSALTAIYCAAFAYFALRFAAARLVGREAQIIEAITPDT